MTSEVRVNTLKARSGLGTVSFNDSGVVVSGIVTANSFDGDGSNLTNIPKIVVETAQSVSGLGTAVPFTSIPSWVKRITVMLDGVSISGTANIICQLGSSVGYNGANTDYKGTYTQEITNSNGTIALTNGFVLSDSTSGAGTRSGVADIVKLTGNTWVMKGIFGYTSTARICYAAGATTLSSTLDRLHVTTSNGTDTFDAGTINIMYEG